VGRLIYSTIMSFDGFTADENGSFDWAAPDEEVHRSVNELERSVGTYLYGRRMYETMLYWETAHEHPAQPDFVLDFARLWQAAVKVVFSRTLHGVHSARTRIERDFDTEVVRELKARADRDLSVGGAELAGVAMKAGLVDELQMFVVPHLAGGGTHALPTGVALPLTLRDERRFGNGTVLLRYEVTPDSGAAAPDR
jgi:dihydrofolate reductase